MSSEKETNLKFGNLFSPLLEDQPVSAPHRFSPSRTLQISSFNPAKINSNQKDKKKKKKEHSFSSERKLEDQNGSGGMGGCNLLIGDGIRRQNYKWVAVEEIPFGRDWTVAACGGVSAWSSHELITPKQRQKKKEK